MKSLKNKTLILLLLLFTTAILSSCSKENNESDNNNGNENGNSTEQIDPNNLKEGQIYIKIPANHSKVISIYGIADDITVNWGDGNIEQYKSFPKYEGIYHRYEDEGTGAREILLTTSGLTLFGGEMSPNNKSITPKPDDYEEVRFGYCPNLEYIHLLGYDKLKSIDVSKATSLKRLWCVGTGITKLDVTKNTELVMLYCSANNLTSINLSQNTKLDILHCYNNHLTSLDLSNNKALTYIDFAQNQLSFLDISNNKLLTYIACDFNQVSESSLVALVNSLPNNPSYYYNPHEIYLEYDIEPARTKKGGLITLGNNPGTMNWSDHGHWQSVIDKGWDYLR